MDGRTMLVSGAFLGVLLAPLGVEAATDSVTIKDPGSASKANVNKGKLEIGDGKGPLTVNGAVKVTNQPAVQRVEVVTPGEPRNRFSRLETVNEDPVMLTGALTGESQLFVNTVTVTNESAGPVTLLISTFASETQDTCDGPILENYARIAVPQGETTHATYPDHIVLAPPETGQWCLGAWIDNGEPLPGELWVQVTGLG